eukprot:m51a1_g11921 hypothetical protein (468) ;mRNA; r:667943-669792
MGDWGDRGQRRNETYARDAYFKDNVIEPGEDDSFDASAYFYRRDRATMQIQIGADQPLQQPQPQQQAQQQRVAYGGYSPQGMGSPQLGSPQLGMMQAQGLMGRMQQAQAQAQAQQQQQQQQVAMMHQQAAQQQRYGPPDVMSALTRSGGAAEYYQHCASPPQFDHQKEFALAPDDFPALPGQDQHLSEYQQHLLQQQQAAAAYQSAKAKQMSSPTVQAQQPGAQQYMYQMSQYSPVQQQSVQYQQQLQQQQHLLQQQQMQQRIQQMQQQQQLAQRQQAAAAAAAAAAVQSKWYAPAVMDRYSMMGLLSVIRASNPDLSNLALGIDLTSLGLNLAANNCLHATFVTPFGKDVTKPDPEYHLPLCYLQQRELDHPIQKVPMFADETLFYIFYSMPRDELQLAAAKELCRNDWKFHKELKVWIKRAPGTDPITKNNAYEHGSWVYFDVGTWEVTRKDNFVVFNTDLEKIL